MIINHNISSMFASRMESLNTSTLQSSMEKLSSGERINKAGNDASGLAVSEKHVERYLLETTNIFKTFILIII